MELDGGLVVWGGMEPGPWVWQAPDVETKGTGRGKPPSYAETMRLMKLAGQHELGGKREKGDLNP